MESLAAPSFFSPVASHIVVLLVMMVSSNQVLRTNIVDDLSDLTYPSGRHQNDDEPKNISNSVAATHDRDRDQVLYCTVGYQRRKD
jgi:hypothetical protein